MKQGLISIIIPIYNVEKYLKKCVDSVINQTYKNIEIILVDDGSTDSSSKICDEYKLKDKRIKVIHKENGGLSDARNFGLNIAKGNYISFVDSDDFINSKMIEDLYKVITNVDCDIVFGNVKDYYDYEVLEDKIEFKMEDIKLKNTEECLKNINVRIYNIAYPKLFKASLFKTLRFPKGLNYEDSYITPYIYDMVKNVALLPYNYYYRLIREDSIVHKKFSEKDYDLIKVGEARVEYYKNASKELVVLSYQFLMSNIINLYKKAYQAQIEKSIKNKILEKYKITYNTIKKQLNFKDKIKYSSFSFFSVFIVKLLLRKDIKK